MTGEAEEEDKRLRAAKVDWDASAPRSILFDDIYFSGDGAAESEHVFLNGNDLAARFSSVHVFSIGELGFGTGLNFLSAWKLWRETKKPQGARLRFFSVEGFPLAAEDLARSHEAWPELSTYSAKLRAALPPRIPGVHRIELEDDVALSLHYGPAEETLARAEGGVDAWFFDGFSPAKNPAMWAPEIFAECARLSNPGATFATFTVAGDVRRAIASAGFALEKRPGFGRKREMLCGRIDTPLASSRRAPWFRNAKPCRFQFGASLGVIGGGVAGASLAHAARRAGFTPTIIEEKGLAAGASGNPAGLIMPRLDLGGGPASHFFLHSYLYTIRLLNEIGGDWFTPCGVLLRSEDDDARARQKRLLDEALLPPDWMAAREDGLFFPQGGVVEAPAYVAALTGDAKIINAKANSISPDEDGVTVRVNAGAEHRFDALVIANGVDASRILEARALPLSAIAGQIDWFPDETPPAHAIAFGPYAAPAPRGGLVIGATYEKIAQGATARTSLVATQSNIEAVAGILPGLDANNARPRASLRCQTPDRIPIAGPLPDLCFYAPSYDDLRLGKQRAYPPAETVPHVYILTGLGSRGLVTAPLAAAMILAELTGEPSPVDHEIAEALHPARFFIRDYKRAQHIRKK